MRLFRVEKEWGTDPNTRRAAIPYREQRMLITKSDQGVGVQFRGELNEDGEEGPPTLVLPVSKGLAAPFEADESLEVLPLKAARISGKKDEPKVLSPPSQHELDKIARLESGERGDDYFGYCLVHVTLPLHDPNGKIWFMAESYEQVRVQVGRMYKADREYHPLQKALDSGVLECLFISQDGGEALFVMIPGASFRIYRDEETLPRGESPVLQVTFDGKELGVFRPRKYERKQRRRNSKRPPERDVVTQAYEATEN
jgi:hypothetical protein